MEHIEDLIFNEGVDGTRKAIFFLRDLRDMLSGHTKSHLGLTVKFDGAPAIFAGIDPEDGKFFVAKKGLFNKNPKLYKSQREVDQDLSGDLRDKFSIALKEFSKLGIRKNVYQGDLLFTKKDIKKQTIDGEKYLTFQPNTILYAVPEKSDLGKEIAKAEIGMAWHTLYTGNTIQGLKASFGKNLVSDFKKNSRTYNTGVDYKDLSGTATFTDSETEELNKILSETGSLFQTMDSSVFKSMLDFTELRDRIKIFNNTKVRAGQRITKPEKHVSDLIDYLTNYWDGQIDSKKTEASKEKYREKKEEMLGWFTPRNRAELVKIFYLMNFLVQAKEMIVTKLSNISKMKTFLRTKDGFEVTDQEGFVAIDLLSHNAIKLVDRMEFSRANFSPEILKGWTK